ncbi:MAG: Terminase [Bacteriophage sp.]|nr:MAG: Terminase [Bacteriophage sp.]
MAILIETNEYQTPITEELLSQYPEEVVQQFTEIVNIVPFIKNLINPNRPKIEDLPRDKEGRAIVDITNPPIYKDADYFRQAALFYLKNDCYTKLRPNSNPNSEYRKYWREELRRCREGLIRQSDGMYVTGFLYWFLNYCPMMVNFYKEGQKKAIRKESFGFFFEGIWWRSIYLYNAREQGHHAIELAKRGCAKSYFLATIMSHNLIVGESEATHKRCITVLTAAQKEYLKDDKDGTLNKFIPELSFVIDNTPFPNLLLKNSPNEMSWQMGYKKPNGAIGGSMNQVLGVSAKDDSDKLRGKRGWILYEEMGTFDGLLELYDVTRKSVEDGDYTFSCMYLVGTANNKESSFLSAKKLLYAPESYNIQSVPNVYDKKGSGKDVFGFFFPAYINRAGCYNKDGISDVIKALLQVLMARYKAKYGADPTSVLRVIAEDPITPAEAIIKVKDAFFPVASLQERADTLDKNPSLYDDVYVGELYTTGTGEIEFRPTDDIPIRTYPVDNDTKGALEIYSMPKKDREGKVFNDRYIIGVDPYDNDQAESHSLYSIFVLDTFVDNLAAEYTGRTNFADEAHDMVLKLCIFYNAKALYESNKKGLYSYMEKTRNTFRLADTPEYLRDKQLVKYSSFGSNAKGVNVSANINNFANRLIKDWLLMKVPIEVKQEDGHIEIQEVPKLYTLKTRALIEEAIQFNPDINVDRIRALGILMLYREQYIIRYGTGRTESSSERLSKDYAGNDEFFTKNFDARHIGKQ